MPTEHLQLTHIPEQYEERVQLDSNEHYFRERYHIPRIPCGDHLLVCVLYLYKCVYFIVSRHHFTFPNCITKLCGDIRGVHDINVD
jgi:hypothetical protein